MNYTKIYKSLIERAKFENRKKGNGVYYESHHIIPDFMFKERKRKGPKGHLSGNPNDKENLVLLTEREHILAHILLAKSLKENDRYWASAATGASGASESSVGPGNSAMFPFLPFRGLVLAIVSTYFPPFFGTLTAVLGTCWALLQHRHYYSTTLTRWLATLGGILVFSWLNGYLYPSDHG